MPDFDDNNEKLKPFTLFNNQTGKSYEIPIIKSAEGPSVLDIMSLYNFRIDSSQEIWKVK